MPTTAELIAKIQAAEFEGSGEIAQQLAANIKSIEDNSKTAVTKIEKEMETILAVVSAEGNSTAEKATDAAKKIGQLTQQVATLTTEKESSQLELKTLQQNLLLNQVKEKSGVNTNVLKTLISDEDKVEVIGDKVTVNGTEIKDWATANQPDFLASLFPKSDRTSDLPEGGSKGSDHAQDLPEGGSGGDDKNKTSKDYVDHKYNSKAVGKLISAI